MVDVGLALQGFSKLHVMTTRPATYKKSKHYIFEEKTYVLGVLGDPDQNKN